MRERRISCSIKTVTREFVYAYSSREREREREKERERIMLLD